MNEPTDGAAAVPAACSGVTTGWNQMRGGNVSKMETTWKPEQTEERTYRMTVNDKIAKR